MDNTDISYVEGQIGYRFRNSDLLQQAFVRRSYAVENGGEDNEVLEFIGDRVLDLIVVKLLTDRFGWITDDADWDEFACERTEAELTRMKKRAVQRDTLARRIEVLGLADYLIMGKGDERQQADRRESVREDLFEAIVGAAAIDCGWDLKVLEDLVEVMLDPDTTLFEGNEDNPVSAVNDWFWKEYGEYPEFHYGAADHSDQLVALGSTDVKSKNFWDDDGSPWRKMKPFKCVLEADGRKFIGFGTSKSLARRDVCALLLSYLIENDMLYTIRDEIKNPNRAEAISQLEILARRGYFSIPTYEFSQSSGQNGDPVWKCVCRIAEEEKSFSAKASVKKEAKKTAAYHMLRYVLEE